MGAGRGRARIPGPGRGGRKTRGWEQRGPARERPRGGRPGSPLPPPRAHSHARGHTHAHAPRRAGADVSLKASHLHSEGRGLAAAAERGLRPHVPAPRETPSFGAAGGRGPCPALTPAPLPQAALPSLPFGADRAGAGPGPAPGLPQPLIAGARGPGTAKLRFAFLEPPFLGAPSPTPAPLCYLSPSPHLRPGTLSPLHG